jgi:hypothetical protein
VLLPGLGRGVRIVAAERIVLSKRVRTAVVAIALVARHDDHRARVGLHSQRLQHLCGPGHVDRERLDRLAQPTAHQRLGGHVDDDLGPGAGDRRSHLALGPYVAAHVAGEPVGHVGDRVQRRLAHRA